MSINIIKIYKESFYDVRYHRREWFKVAFGPYLTWLFTLWLLSLNLIIFPFGLSGNNFKLEEMKLFYTNDDPTVFLISLIISAIAYRIINFMIATSLSINGYRYAVLNEGGDRWISYNLNMRFVKIIIYGILVGVTGITYLFICLEVIKAVNSIINNTFVNVILISLFGLYGFYLLGRIALYAVVISVDQKEPIKTSWHLMKGNALRLIVLFMLFWLTITFTGLIGTLVLGSLTLLLSSGGAILATIGVFLGTFFGLFLIMFNWALTSKAMGLIYQELSAKIDAEFIKKYKGQNF
ncbi:MAG: hypothetical protein H0X26_00270 [Alphaproteobacteria bacterium]|nr:hypothetical protein [Alphaproteobacteria bacterium]